MSEKDPDRAELGYGLIVLISIIAVPVGAFLAWALMLALTVVFGVEISLDWAFGLVVLAGLIAGPAVLGGLLWRRARRDASALRRATATTKGVSS